MDHNELKKTALLNKKVKKEFNDLEPEFSLLHSILSARKKSGLTQADIAKRMGIKPPAVTRFETSLTSGKHSPSISTLKKYAHVLGYNLEIRFVQN